MIMEFISKKTVAPKNHDLVFHGMRKIVKPFDPAEVARLCPIVREVIVMGDEDD